MAASSDHGLYLLEKTSVSEESIFKFGGGLTGHHGRINDIAFCGGRGENGVRYVASVSGQLPSFYISLFPDLF